MKEKLPLGVMIFMGVLGFTGRFMSHPVSETFHGFLRNKMLVLISVFALVLGLGNLIIHHVNRIKGKGQFWPQSWVLLLGLGISTVIGIFGGVRAEGWLPTRIGDFAFDIQTLYFKVLIPLQSTLFALLAFYMASAAYRAFRARSVLAALLLLSAFVVMIGQVPLGAAVWPALPDISQWILEVPNTASQRGITLGVTLGVLANMLKILTGIESNWMGGRK
jgi:hypothetical protein